MTNGALMEDIIDFARRELALVDFNLNPAWNALRRMGCIGDWGLRGGGMKVCSVKLSDAQFKV